MGYCNQTVKKLQLTKWNQLPTHNILDQASAKLF